MTKVSRIKVESEKMEMFIDDFWTAIASLKNKDEAKAFFEKIITPTEQKMFGKRFQIVMMLVMEYSYEEIMSRLKVSVGTIASISRQLTDDKNILSIVGKRVIGYKKGKLEQIRDDDFSLAKKLSGEVVDLTFGSVVSLANRYQGRK